MEKKPRKKKVTDSTENQEPEVFTDNTPKESETISEMLDQTEPPANVIDEESFTLGAETTESATAEPEVQETQTVENFKKPRKKRSPNKVKTQIDIDLSEDQQDETAQDQEGNGISLTKALKPDFLVSVLDKLMSTLVPLAINAMSKTKVSPRDFALTAGEKRDIAEPLGEACETVKINFTNPWVNLGIVVAGIYGAKAIEVINFDSYGEPKRKRSR